MFINFYRRICLFVLLWLASLDGLAIETQQLTPGFYPALRVGYAWLDNVFRSEKQEKADTVFQARPMLHWKAGTVVYDLNARYQGNYGVYRVLDEQDYMDHTLSIGFGLHPTEKMALELSDRYKIGHDQPGISGTQVFAPPKPNRWHDNRFRAQFTYGRRIATAQLQLAYEEATRRFQNNQREFSDRNQHTGTATWLYHVLPKTWLVTEFQYQINDFQMNKAFDQDSDQWHVFQGASWEISAVTQGEILLGYLRSTPKDQRFFKPFSGFGARISINWQPRTYSRVTLRAERMPQLGSTASAFFLANRIGLTLQHEPTERIRIQTSAAYEKDDYSFNRFGPERQDRFLRFGLEINYAMLHWLNLGLGYSHDIRNSSLRLSDYAANTISFHVQILPEYARNP
ncbi:polysaccharide biosynthesis protein VpsM [Methylomarinovum caldicuralii]|uniref:Polysaccharide biosynthesis protein VpsM n=1 Tax=Methylomarinovum caldicuralii TaxID=438856 RepID=A0AAU9C9J7_9GAMM|nr:outer membrane beta-barrel protein [Methylomarinovum caldicuralii]BCX82236.1 polysaccharide biosynthesis protein VpsM [Methylomarinovum caldicuralii]